MHTFYNVTLPRVYLRTGLNCLVAGFFFPLLFLFFVKSTFSPLLYCLDQCCEFATLSSILLQEKLSHQFYLSTQNLFFKSIPHKYKKANANYQKKQESIDKDSDFIVRFQPQKSMQNSKERNLADYKVIKQREGGQWQAMIWTQIGYLLDLFSLKLLMKSFCKKKNQLFQKQLPFFTFVTFKTIQTGGRCESIIVHSS